jgi:hypothetical protein
MPSNMLFKDLLDNANKQDPRLPELWKLVLNSNLADLDRTDIATRKLFEDRINQSVTQDDIQI